ncbi:ABC transporter ATP-binding protein [Candidatus Bathyarchaeota archaeon]|nr:ABC transporter ATP-binding protein [Candidatus Bathyarchaeota archaeon]
MEYDVELEGVTKVFDGVVAVDDVTMKIEKGKLTFFLGPSGCGKTTLLRLIGGLEEPTSGIIKIKGEDMTRVPAYRRPTRTVFQEWLLFPHMSVYDNIAYGLKILKAPKAEIERRVKEALELVGLTGYERRRPDELSGGEKQRVALARAMVCKPEILLLDEPIGSLDAKMRKQMQIELKNIQKELGTTFIYVTHDQEEALTMADVIAVMNKGKVEQVGSPKEIYDEPKTRFVAEFIGETNLLPCRVVEDGEGVVTVSSDGLNITARKVEGISLGDEAFISIRPRKIKIKGAEALDNVYPAVVRDVIFHGEEIRFIVELEDGRRLNVVTPRIGEYEKMGTGQRIEIGWSAADSMLVKKSI